MTIRSAAALQAVIAGILFSTGGAAVKATELDAWQVAGTRSLIAAAVLLCAIPAARRWAGGAGGGGRRAAVGPVWWRSPARRRALLLTVATGCCYCLTLVLFVHASKRTTAAETIFLQSTAPLFVLLLSPLLLRERLTGRQLLFVPLFGAGLVMAFFGGAEAVASAPDPRVGNVLALGCGLAYGLTLIGLRAAGRPPPGGPPSAARGEASSAGDGAAPRASGIAPGHRDAGTFPLDSARAPGIAAAACGNVIVGLLCLPTMASLGSAAPRDLLIVAGLGLFQVALAYVFVTRAARALQAPVLALLLLLEPALSPFWAMWLHGEEPRLLTWLGGGVVALATVLLAAMARSPERGRSTRSAQPTPL